MTTGKDLSRRMWYPSKERALQLDAHLASLEKAPADCDAKLGAFLVRVSACIRRLAVNESVPPSSLRDWIWIGSQYRINLKLENRTRALTRRALLYLELSLNTGAARKVDFRREINWIADSTVSDLRAEMGPNEYSCFLSPEELQRVEDRLDSLRASASQLSTEEDAALDTYLALFADISSETYLPGVVEMLSRLRKAARTDGDDYAAAVACLRYVLKKQDIVPDTLGYLGLVDDIHAIEWTYREIENRSTWSPLLERFNFEFPYVARVAFDEDRGAVRCSPFMQTVFGVALHSLRQEGHRTCLVVPETGINGLIGAFLASVESIRGQAAANGVSQSELVPGEDILLGDTNVIVRARYLGTFDYEGKTYHHIELKKAGKMTVSKDVLWFARRSPTSHRNLSGINEFNEWKKRYCPTSLTHLVGREFRFDDLRPEVLLVTRRNQLDDQLPQIRPMGSTVAGLVGLKYITSTGVEVNLPGTNLAEPLIWSCSDAATAREIIISTNSSLTPRFVIVDQVDLASELEDILVPGDEPAQTSRVVFSGLHEREATRNLVDRNYETWLLRQADVDLVPGSLSRSSRRRTGAVSRYQQRQATQALVTTGIHEIRCEPVEFLYEYVRELRQKLRQTDDPQIEVITIAASAFIRRFSGAPLEFDEIEHGELRGLLNTLVTHCSTLADFHPDVRNLAEHAKAMLEDALPPNPRHIAVSEIISNSGRHSVAVLCRSAHAAAVAAHRVMEDPDLSHVSWLSIQQLRDTAPFGHLIVPGWFDRLTMREIRNNGYADHVDLVLYGFEQEWEVRSRKAGQSWERRLNSRMGSQWRSLEKQFGELPKPAVVRLEDPEPEEHFDDGPDNDLLEERIIETIRSRVFIGLTGKELARARLVAFETPGSYIYLPPHGSVVSLTRALEAVSERTDDNKGAAGQEAERLIICPVSDIRRGELLAFPIDRNPDLLDSLADGFIRESEKTRRLAGLWRTALQDYLQQTRSSLRELQMQLQKAGLKRHPLTVRMWVTGTHIIAPMNYPEAVSVISELTHHKELTTRIDEVKSAIDLVYRGRGRAAEELLKQLTHRDVEIHEGMASVTVEGRQIHYQLHRVLIMDPVTDVPRDEIGILKNITDLPLRIEASDQFEA